MYPSKQFYIGNLNIQGFWYPPFLEQIPCKHWGITYILRESKATHGFSIAGVTVQKATLTTTWQVEGLRTLHCLGTNDSWELMPTNLPHSLSGELWHMCFKPFLNSLLGLSSRCPLNRVTFVTCLFFPLSSYFHSQINYLYPYLDSMPTSGRSKILTYI